MLEEYLARKKWRKTIGCLVVPLIVLLLLGGAFFAFRIYCSGRVQAELDAIAEPGYPVTLEALNAWYPEPMGENAADTYLRAFAKFVEPPDEPADVYMAPSPRDANLPIVGSGQLPAAGEPLPEEMREAIEQYLEANREALELLHEAAGIEECRYPLDMTDGHALLLSHLQKIRAGTRLLRLEALHHAHRGDGEKAAHSLSAALARPQKQRVQTQESRVKMACCTLASTLH